MSRNFHVDASCQRPDDNKADSDLTYPPDEHTSLLLPSLWIPRISPNFNSVIKLASFKEVPVFEPILVVRQLKAR